MEQDRLFERLWNGTAPLEEWTQTVSDGAVTAISEDIISVHTTYFCGCVTVIRTTAGLVFIDTAKPDTAGKTLAAVRRWDNSPVHTVIYPHGHIDHTSGIRLIDEEADARGVPRPRIVAHRNVLRRLSRYEVSHGFNSIVNPRPQPNWQPSWRRWQAVKTSWRNAPRRLLEPGKPGWQHICRVGEHRVAPHLRTSRPFARGSMRNACRQKRL